jgi:hypothetical protein
MEPSGSDANYKSVRENCGSNGDVAVVLFLGFGAVEMCMDEERGKKKQRRNFRLSSLRVRGVT